MWGGTDRRASLTAKDRLEGRKQCEPPARAPGRGPGGNSWPGEDPEVKAALRGEMPGPGEGLMRAGRGHVPQEDQCRWDWCISPSLRTQSPADSNDLTRHMVETRAGAVITLPSIYFPCVFRSALGRQFQHESQAHWGRVSSQPWWQRLWLPGCRLGFPTRGPAWNKWVHNLRVFKSTAPFSRLWESQVHSHTF